MQFEICFQIQLSVEKYLGAQALGRLDPAQYGHGSLDVAGCARPALGLDVRLPFDHPRVPAGVFVSDDGVRCAGFDLAAA